jgi:hypothetical protein
MGGFRRASSHEMDGEQRALYIKAREHKMSLPMCMARASIIYAIAKPCNRDGLSQYG